MSNLDGRQPSLLQRSSVTFLLFAIFFFLSLVQYIAFQYSVELAQILLTDQQNVTDSDRLLVTLFCGIPLSTIALVSVDYFYCGKFYRRVLGGFKISSVLPALLLAAFFIFFIYLLNRFIVAIPAVAWSTQLINDASSLFLAVIAIAVFAPLFEELFFRGYLIQVLSLYGINNTYTIILSALFWSFAHSQYGIIDGVIIVVIGVSFATLNHYYQSIYPSLISHAVFNGALILINKLHLI
ncbi:MAG: CPBP family intramembrane glutamic endopeptidase [Kangiellaceae bacterium]|jgi:membrane protease YdiL (CAAX protease family)|nr:CPBP family intramembrane glutamic endopeptidase [Kangiellaceae bacterium]